MNKVAQAFASIGSAGRASYKGKSPARILLDQGHITAADLADTLVEQEETSVSAERLMRNKSLVADRQVTEAQALSIGKMCLDLAEQPPDEDLADLLSPVFCLEHCAVPWMRVGDAILVATSRPEGIADLRDVLEERLGPVMLALATETDIHAIIAERHGQELVELAETQVSAEQSCRDINKMSPLGAILASLFFGISLGLLITFPKYFFLAAVFLAVFNLVATQGLKIATFLFGRKRPDTTPRKAELTDHPVVSVLVPLLDEDRIATTLVKPLSRLTYPKALLDVILIVEANDAKTRETLETASLPPWMRVVEVPESGLQTKPRALNYALKFSRGDIIGVLDAEDAPAIDQIDRVVEQFHHNPDVACVQGILDFYNPQANWLSRCFSIEYATWFRIILPGATRMGFAIPLGGTTVYLRRDALEHVGGWDAHNVTEDADLGVRLARYGYKTELINTVTKEEANNRVWPWIKQRSRWLKGYLITYLVHMRNPIRTLREMGSWKFFGFQLFFVTTILQFTLAPFLWTFWLVIFGFPHPFVDALPGGWIGGLVALFLITELISLVIAFYAVARSQHESLMIWVPTMLLYFPLGVIAMYKAISETLFNPFYWDKTKHGVSPPDKAGGDIHMTKL